MAFSGKYVGTLWYGKGYTGQQMNAELSFEMDIQEENNWFTDIAIDIEGSGKNPYEARIGGLINGIYIEFEKIYRRGHSVDGQGNTVLWEREGFPILYQGTYNDDTGYYEGSWKYNVTRRFLFFFRKPYHIGEGTFRLKKIENEIP